MTFVGEQGPDEQWPVAVISRDYLASLLEMLSQAGLDVVQVIPEILVIPFNAGEYSVLVSREVALVRTGAASGFAVDSDNLGMLLAASAVVFCLLVGGSLYLLFSWLDRRDRAAGTDQQETIEQLESYIHS